VAIGFWTLDHPTGATAIVNEDGRKLTYGDLRDASDQFVQYTAKSTKTLGFVLCRNTPECLIAYLGALRSGNAVCLLDADLQRQLLTQLLDTYMPEWVFAMDGIELTHYSRHKVNGGFLYLHEPRLSIANIAPELAVLLPTSGSTGSPMLVRLSRENLQANACSIVEYLEITSNDRAITSLPMAYSYGLSVIQSHLLAGATLLMTTNSFLQREFWNLFQEEGATSLAGVPYHYEVMLRMKMLQRSLPSLRILTQAGGRLSPDLILQMEKISAEYGWQFFVMYGQTEAAARISYVPAEMLRQKIGSIGISIPRGQLSLDADSSELLYSGPNVMLGYAKTRTDLAKGNELNGQLRTGDLARYDDDGYFYITGRLKRFLKIFGKRFNLDEMESVIENHLGVAVACFGRDDLVAVAIEGASAEALVSQVMRDILKLHPSAFRIVKLDSLPRLANGKRDYQSLEKLEVI
jgi:acyl-CoA synthetase (AMP-forming)/AMP-acid ligase II